MTDLPDTPWESLLAEAQQERDSLMAATWRAFVESGGDPDGNLRWHCDPEMAGRRLLDAVRSLRDDYDACPSPEDLQQAERERDTLRDADIVREEAALKWSARRRAQKWESRALDAEALRAAALAEVEAMERWAEKAATWIEATARYLADDPAGASAEPEWALLAEYAEMKEKT